MTMQASAASVSYPASKALLWSGRALLGVPVAFSVTTSPMYLSEISPKESRGFIGGLFQFTLMVFLVIASGIGMGINSNYHDSEDSYQYAVWWMVPVGLCVSIAMYFNNETPQFLLLQGKYDEAEVVFYHLRKGADTKSAQKEYQLMKEDIDEQKALGEVTYRELFSGFPLRIVLITSLMQLLQQWSGMNFFNNFAPKLYIGVVNDPALFGFIGTIIQLIGTVPSALIVDRVGRRPLLMGGAVVLGLAWFVIAILGDTIIHNPEQCLKVITSTCPEGITDCNDEDVFTNKYMGIESICSLFQEQGSANYTTCSSSLNFTEADTFNLGCMYTSDGAPTATDPSAHVSATVGYLVLIMSYVIDFVFGLTLGPIVWSYNAEICPTKYRAQILGLAAASNLFWTGVILYVPGQVIPKLGFDTFWMFVGLMVIACAFFYWIVETKGLPIEIVTEKWENKLNCKYTNLHHTENGTFINDNDIDNNNNDTDSDKEKEEVMP